MQIRKPLSQPQLFKFQRGISLIEVLVVTAILGLLMALIFPAIQQARESARRTQCSSQLRQIATAVSNYDSVYSMYPTGASNHATWLLTILPQIGETNRYEAFKSQGSVVFLGAPAPPLYQCPSDPLATGSFSSYAGNYGAVVQRDGANGLFRNAPTHLNFLNHLQISGYIRPRDVTDGTSNTALVSEALAAPSHLHNSLIASQSRRLDWVTPQPLPAPDEAERFIELCGQMPTGAKSANSMAGSGWYGIGISSTFYTHHLPPNSPRCVNGSDLYLGSYSPSSLHGNGAFVAFADGHVRFISSAVDRKVWQALGSRNGGEPILTPF